MSSINEIKNYIQAIFEQSLTEYKKLNNSKSMNHLSREKLATAVLNKHLVILTKNVELKEEELRLIIKEVANKLIKN